MEVDLINSAIWQILADLWMLTLLHPATMITGYVVIALIITAISLARRST